MPAPKEFVLHRAVADHLRAFARPDWRWTHFPAGEKRDPLTAAKLKAMGLRRGWPDFLLVALGGLLHALELKRRSETMREEQESFAAWCWEQGIPFECTACGRPSSPYRAGALPGMPPAHSHAEVRRLQGSA
jgi:hypothetical protein